VRIRSGNSADVPPEAAILRGLTVSSKLRARSLDHLRKIEGMIMCASEKRTHKIIPFAPANFVVVASAVRREGFTKFS
ncbi:hypothetical protein, partial [Pseudomonas aeruginosa]|uniref:hypothetical protein n=1 Tax=Pseudomonas aeruginosa TaxID=287 RepID=UPI002AB49963